MVNIKSPCLMCKDRIVDNGKRCEPNCEKHKEWKANCEKIKKELLKKRDINRNLNAVQYYSINRQRKKKGQT